MARLSWLLLFVGCVADECELDQQALLQAGSHVKKGSESRTKWVATARDTCETLAFAGATLSTSYQQMKDRAKDLCETKYVEYGGPSSQAQGRCQAGLTVIDGLLASPPSTGFDRTSAVSAYCLALFPIALLEVDEALGEVDEALGCFPADATVKVLEGGSVHKKPLADVKAGSLVQVADPSSHKIKFSKLLLDSKSDEEHLKDAEFLMIQHEHGSINLTTSHFIKTKEHGFLPAEMVEVGNVLLVHDGSGNLVETRIQNKIVVNKLGLFNPVTWDGVLLVDDILVSTHVRAELSWIPQDSLDRLVQKLGGWDQVHNVHQWASVPFLLLHTSGVASLFRGTWFHGIFFPTKENAAKTSTGNHNALFHDYSGRLAGGALSLIV